MISLMSDDQISFASGGFERFLKATRRAIFLSAVESHWAGRPDLSCLTFNC